MLRKGDSTAHLRMDAVNEETLKQYYDLLEDTLKENNLMDSPSCVYNVDKMGIPLDPNAPSGVFSPIKANNLKYVMNSFLKTL